MKSIITHITLFSILLFSLVRSFAYSATERRTALVIGNGSYAAGPLQNPVNDAADMADTLRRLGFEVILKNDVRHQENEGRGL